MNKYHSRWFLR